MIRRNVSDEDGAIRWGNCMTTAATLVLCALSWIDNQRRGRGTKTKDSVFEIGYDFDKRKN